MTGSEPHPGLVERLKRHHEDAEQRREEAEIESAVGAAGFDLGSDIGRPPATGHGQAGYDVDADLGVDAGVDAEPGRGTDGARDQA
ncbi:hypothetical protein [Streptacidiphilus fuscans]|uniref:Uncharacterized protein n=1 Tax=Streptacidiphilus fuscans TaxID=2789292 RepID=A0A931B057_9ACTN|nr:hypothetical protein [Streptacidiphilus fuscans]MBF9066712.1 hypothetical protein [Streptacidiphilus fuscans]